MKILVTGSRGIIGTQLCHELQFRAHLVYGCDLMHSEDDRYARADVGEYRQIRHAIEAIRPDFVYHAAGEFGRNNGEANYEAVWRTNAVGTKNMLTLQREFGFRMVFFSSSEIYGDYDGVMHEDVPLMYPIRQLNDYAISKWASEMQILNDSERYGLENVRVRLCNTYGPGEYYSPYRSVVARFCYYALREIPYTVHLGHKRSFLYINDTVRTLANICEHFSPGSCYNIGNETQYRIEDISGIILRLAGKDDSIVVYSNKELLTTTQKQVDISRATKELGHRSTMPIEDGLCHTIEWMRKVYGL